LILDKKVYTMLNDQITKEYYSAYLYLQIAAYFDEHGLDGYASWYEKQAQEEEEHAMKFYRYLHENGQTVKLGQIDAPDVTFNDFLEPVKAALGHEQYITGCINDIMTAARDVHDYRTVEFLQWFVHEQGEEEVNANRMVQLMETFGGKKIGLFFLNEKVKERQ
jgi:ferritin